MTDKQLKMQEAIMIAIHGNIEEAREKENKKWALTSSWFTLLDKDLIFVKWLYNWNYDDYDDKIKHISCLSYPLRDDNWNMVMDENWEIKSVDEDIIWLPPTLSRVLTAIGDNYAYMHWSIQFMTDYRVNKYLCTRELLNEGWGDATLFDQSEETQNTIYKLLCW